MVGYGFERADRPAPSLATRDGTHHHVSKCGRLDALWKPRIHLVEIDCPQLADLGRCCPEPLILWIGAGAFHLGRLLLDAPDDADLKKRRDDARKRHADAR